MSRLAIVDPVHYTLKHNNYIAPMTQQLYNNYYSLSLRYSWISDCGRQLSDITARCSGCGTADVVNGQIDCNYNNNDDIVL